jgi:hypothetical protein
MFVQRCPPETRPFLHDMLPVAMQYLRCKIETGAGACVLVCGREWMCADGSGWICKAACSHVTSLLTPPFLRPPTPPPPKKRYDPNYADDEEMGEEEGGGDEEEMEDDEE